MRRKNCRSRKSWLLTVGALLLAVSVGFGVPPAFKKMAGRQASVCGGDGGSVGGADYVPDRA